MNGSMMQLPLLISSLLVHAERHHGEQEVVSRRVEGDLERFKDYMKTVNTVDWDAVNTLRPEWNTRWNKTVER